MKKIIAFAFLALSFSLAIAHPQNIDQTESIIPSGDLSWAIYQSIDVLNAERAGNALSSTNPYVTLEFPVAGYTNQGFPIFDFSETASDVFRQFSEDIGFLIDWKPETAAAYTRIACKGGEITATVHELVGYDGLETQWVLASELIVQDATGNEKIHLRENNGGFHLPDWSDDERYIAISYGANRDENTGMRIFDLENGDLIADLPAPERFLINAPEWAGSRAYVTLDSWYSKTIVVLGWDSETGGTAYAEFTPEEFTYFAGFSPEGIVFQDCDGEQAIIDMDFVRLGASL